MKSKRRSQKIIRNTTLTIYFSLSSKFNQPKIRLLKQQQENERIILIYTTNMLWYLVEYYKIYQIKVLSKGHNSGFN